MNFEQFFELTVRMFKSMAWGILIYPLFVAVSVSLDLNIHHYIPQDKIMRMGVVSMLLSIVFFPLANMLEPYFVRGCRDVEKLGKKMMLAAVFSMALSELIAVFGLIIFVFSADLRYFYLFFVTAFVHLLLNRPKWASWQKRLNNAERR